ncbi:MAG: methyltransferase domain-containing protein [Candidatus Moranbacteria bacterium]|nr:methyltransferase domain-containing protein [Candidatus Moranbacteria bacterium]
MDYNSRYLKKEFYWGMEPQGLVVESIKYLLPNAKVLDLGCGEGRDSFFLAKNGFKVAAVDISEVGINKLKNFAKKERLSIETTVSDVESFLDSCKNFNAIYCWNVLQFVSDDRIFSVINKIKAKTNSGGFNVIASFVAENRKQKEKVLSKQGYYFDEGELKELYKDWKIISYKEELGNLETHGEPEHRHFKVQMIAQKI